MENERGDMQKVSELEKKLIQSSEEGDPLKVQYCSFIRSEQSAAKAC